MNKILLSFIILCSLLYQSKATAQCSYDNSFWADLTPAAQGLTSSELDAYGGDLYTISVTAGETYVFSTCNSSTLGGFDTQLTLYDATGTTVLGYSDDACGSFSEITWVATFTGVVHLLLDEYNCSNTGGGSLFGSTQVDVTWVGPPPPSPCTALPLTPICTSTGLNFPAGTTGTDATVTDPNNNWDCLLGAPDATFYYLEIATSGNINMELNGTVDDVDFIIWGPYSDLATAESFCGDWGTGGANGSVIDCSFDPASQEFPDILSAVAGEVYVMVITNYAGVTQNITLQQTGGTGSTNCSIVSCAADAGTVNTSMSNTNSNNHYLCFGESVTATSNNDYTLPTAVDVAGLGYALYACPPTTGDPDTDPCWTGYYWTGQDFTETNDGNSTYDFVVANPVAGYAVPSGGVMYWVPITMDDFQTTAGSGSDDNLGHDLDGDGCFQEGTPIQVNYLNPITATETLNCQSGSVVVSLSGGYPEAVPAGSYTVTNTSAGTVSQSGTQGETVVVSGIGNGDVVSFTVTDDANGCTFTYSYSVVCPPCSADAGTMTTTIDGNVVPPGSPAVLCWGECLDIQTDSNFVLPPPATPELAELMLAIYLGAPDPAISDPDLDPNFSGFFWTGDNFQDCNDATSTLTSFFGQQQFWMVPITMDDSDDGADPNGTIGLDTDLDGCWALGTPIEIAFLDSITATVADNCQDIVFTLAGGYPGLTGTGTYTVTNTGAGTLNQSGANGEIITISGYTPGQVVSFDVSNDGNSCFNSFSYTTNVPPSATLDNIVNASCGGTDGAINITTTPTNSPCNVTINMFDSFGDGWNNAFIDVLVNGVSIGTYDVPTGGSNTGSFSVNPGDVIDFVFNSGNWDSEITYDIVIGGSTVFNDGPSPFVGTAFTYTCPIVNYSWSNGATTEDISGLAAGTYTVTLSDDNGCTATAGPFTVVEAGGVTATLASVTDVACNGDLTGAVDINATGGVTPYVYSWSNGATTQDISGVGAGTYTVTVTDNNGAGCTSTVTATISEPTALTASAVATDANCNGANDGSVNLTVSGGTTAYGFSWSNGATTEDLTNVGAGTYTVTVTDANGCTITASATVNEPTALTASTTVVDATCGGSNGSINLTVNGGSPAYTYIWSNGATTEDISALSPGSYTVTIADANGCTITTSANVNTPSGITLTATPTDVACNGDATGSIDLTVAGGSPAYTFDWSNGATTEDISNLTAGSYTVTVTDNLGCQTTLGPVTITEPTALSSSAITVDVDCNAAANGSINLTITGGTAPYTYSWDNGATTEDLTGLSGGSYNVTATDANGCTIVDGPYTISEPTALAISNIITTDASCAGGDGAIDITVNGGTPTYTYSWNNGATTEDLSGLDAGTYVVDVIDGNGCSATTTVTINSGSNVSVSLVSTTDESCAIDSSGAIDISVSGGTAPYTFLWDNGDTSQNLSNVTGGTYSVTATDANGCEASLSGTINNPVVPVLNATIGSDSMIINDTAVVVDAGNDQSSSGVSYDWTSVGTGDAGFGNTTDPSTTVQPDEVGDYIFIVTATSNEGCIAVDSVSFVVTELNDPQIPSAFTPNGDDVNETFKVLFLETEYLQEFKVFNRWGEIVYDHEVDGNGQWDGTFNGVEQPADAYIYLISWQLPGDAEATVVRGSVTLLR